MLQFHNARHHQQEQCGGWNECADGYSVPLYYERPEIDGGRPIIKGTRITVKAIIGYYKLGLSVEEMLEDVPSLTPAQIYEALSYYHDHQVEVERDIEESRAERLIERYGLKIAENGRIVAEEK